MDDGVVARARLVVNPFVSNRVDSAWDPEAVDVEAINRTAFERCRETIDLVRSTGRCRGLLLSGEPGSGKTHLLYRLRRHVQREGRDWFVYVPPVSGPDRFFRDLLQHTVQDLVGNRPGSSSSQLETLLVRGLLRAQLGGNVDTVALWGSLRRRHPPGRKLFDWLEERMEKLSVQLQLDAAVTRALRHYLSEHHRFDAYAWLLGRSVPETVLERLGIARTLEEDGDALQALVTLSRLTGPQSVLVMTFDQLEGLQVDERDEQGLRAFASGLARLFVECRNVATISCVQTYFKQDLERAVPPAHMDRVAQDQGALTPLDREAARQLVAERLRVVSELRSAREALGADPLWPLDPQDIARAIPAGGVPARQLLNECRDRFERWRRDEPPGSATTEPPHAPGPRRRARSSPADAGRPVPSAGAPTPESLDDLWEARRERAASEPPDEGVLADGLLKLVDARSPGKGRRGGGRDVDLVIGAPGDETGVAVCHAENMTSLAARLRRLQSLAGSGRFKRLVLIRDERLPISPGARATRDRLQALERAGHAVLRPPAEAYAAVAAARQLLAEAAAGDLSLNGRPVASEDLKAWLAGRLDAAGRLVDALDVGEGGSPAPSSEVVGRVREFLEGQWVASAAVAAGGVGLDEATLVAGLTTGQHLIGVLTGPPAVLFLRPEGLKRA